MRVYRLLLAEVARTGKIIQVITAQHFLIIVQNTVFDVFNICRYSEAKNYEKKGRNDEGGNEPDRIAEQFDSFPPGQGRQPVNIKVAAMFFYTIRFHHEWNGLFFIIHPIGFIFGKIILDIGDKSLFKCVGVTRADKIFWRSAGQYMAHTHEGDPVAAACLIHVMGSHKYGNPVPSGEIDEQVPEMVSGHRINT